MSELELKYSKMCINHTHIVQNIKSEQNIQLSMLKLKEKCCNYTETTRTLSRIFNLNKLHEIRNNRLERNVAIIS